MKKKKTNGIVLLHAHGQAAPGDKRSYMKMGTYKTKAEAVKAGKHLDGARYAPKSKVKATKYKGLYYIEPTKKKRSRTVSAYSFRLY